LPGSRRARTNRIPVNVPGRPFLGFKVQLAATDDHAVPPAADADARAMVRADHFELWFCRDGEHSPECEETPSQLGVARTATGGALARWLRRPPRPTPVPAVSVEKDQLVVILPTDPRHLREGR
jgi:hypothetical protein